MPSAVANWGYLQPGDKPDTWNANLQLNHPTELLSYI